MITALSHFQTWMQQHDPISYRWAYGLILIAVLLIVRNTLLGPEEKEQDLRFDRAEGGKKGAFGERGR